MMKLFNQLLEDSNTVFTGWDFSFIEDTGRVQSELLPWSYGSKARKYLFDAKSLLDMGTGGGEFLSKLPARLHCGDRELLAKCASCQEETCSIRSRTRPNQRRRSITFH